MIAPGAALAIAAAKSNGCGIPLGCCGGMYVGAAVGFTDAAAVALRATGDDEAGA